jgi:AraC-like DNA-binding protein
MRNSSGHPTHRPAFGPSAPPQLLLGSRPSTTGIVRLALGDVPERDRPSRFIEFFDHLGVRYDAEQLGVDPIEIDMTLQGLPGIQLFSGRMQGARYRRTRKSSDPTDDIGLIVNPRGRHLIAQRGREVVLGDGEAVLASLTDPIESTHRAPGDLIVLRCPRPQIVPRLSDRSDWFMRTIPHGSPALGLLVDYAKVACRDDTLASGDLQRMLVTHLYDLMAVSIGATRDAAHAAEGGGLRAARLHAIKEDIARHLGRPELSVARLAGRHGLTERMVQRLFESEGTTFTDYVLSQRLSRAHGMLTDPRRGADKVSTLAYDCGFGDISYFNRVFRRSFGAAPSEIRARARQTHVPGG